jgi:hypothetical protein
MLWETGAAVAGAVSIDVFSSSIARATSTSVDPNRSPITLIACVIAFFIFVICSSGVIEYLPYWLGLYQEVRYVSADMWPQGTAPHSALLVSPNDRSTSTLVEERRRRLGIKRVGKPSKRAQRTVSEAQYGSGPYARRHGGRGQVVLRMGLIFNDALPVAIRRAGSAVIRQREGPSLVVLPR